MRNPIIKRLMDDDDLMPELRSSFFSDFFRIPEIFKNDTFDGRPWNPRIDAKETDNELIISASLPGVDKKDIKVDITDNRITISGERKEENEQKSKTQYIREQRYGSFYRSFTLPVEVKSENAKASYKDGILKIVLPKQKTLKSKLLEIE